MTYHVLGRYEQAAVSVHEDSSIAGPPVSASIITKSDCELNAESAKCIIACGSDIASQCDENTSAKDYFTES